MVESTLGDRLLQRFANMAVAIEEHSFEAKEAISDCYVSAIEEFHGKPLTIWERHDLHHKFSMTCFDLAQQLKVKTDSSFASIPSVAPQSSQP